MAKKAAKAGRKPARKPVCMEYDGFLIIYPQSSIRIAGVDYIVDSVFTLGEAGKAIRTLIRLVPSDTKEQPAG